MRFFSLVIAFAMTSLSLAAPIALVPEPQGGGIAPDAAFCGTLACPDWKREE